MSFLGRLGNDIIHPFGMGQPQQAPHPLPAPQQPVQPANVPHILQKAPLNVNVGGHQLNYATPDVALPQAGSTPDLRHTSTIFSGQHFNNSPYQAFGRGNPAPIGLQAKTNQQSPAYTLMRSPQGQYYYENEGTGAQIHPFSASHPAPFSPARELPSASPQIVNPALQHPMIRRA